MGGSVRIRHLSAGIRFAPQNKSVAKGFEFRTITGLRHPKICKRRMFDHSSDTESFKEHYWTNTSCSFIPSIYMHRYPVQHLQYLNDPVLMDNEAAHMTVSRVGITKAMVTCHGSDCPTQKICQSLTHTHLVWTDQDSTLGPGLRLGLGIGLGSLLWLLPRCHSCIHVCPEVVLRSSNSCTTCGATDSPKRSTAYGPAGPISSKSLRHHYNGKVIRLYLLAIVVRTKRNSPCPDVGTIVNAMVTSLLATRYYSCCYVT